MLEQALVSERFVMACKDWLRAQGRQLAVLTNAQKSRFDPPISQLIRDDAVRHMPTKLFGPNRTIMKRLVSEDNP